MRKVLINSNTYHGFSIDEAIENISKAGYRYIELTATKGWTEHVMANMPLSELLRIKNKLEEYKLVPLSMSGHTNIMDSDRLKDFVDNIYLAHFFNCEFIVTSIGEAHLEDKQVANNDILVENIKSFIPHLEKNNMTLVLEPHGDHGSGVVINEIVELVDSERVKIAYDTANVIFYGDVNLIDDINAIKHNLVYAHLKDKAGERTQWNFPALGEGWIDLEGAINTMGDIPLSIEIEFTEKGPKNIEEVNQAILTSKKYLENCGIKV